MTAAGLGETLVVAPYLPWPADFGGAIRVYELVKGLARDRNVILLAPATPGDRAAIERLSAICDVTAVPASWTFRDPPGPAKRLTQAVSTLGRRSFVERATASAQLQGVLDRLFMTRQITLVHYEFPQMALFRPLRPCPTVIDNHNVEHALLARVATTSSSVPRRLFNQQEARKVARLERRVWADATLNLATSIQDATVIQRGSSAPVRVVPNGVDADAATPFMAAERIPGRVVFVAALRHQPNANAARWYANEIHPRVRAVVPDATFEIVGGDPPVELRNREREGILVTGRVEQVWPHLARASVAVAPIRAGGGTRLKILEAFAARVPLVATTLGAEGLDVVPDRHLLIADDASAFAGAVVRALLGEGLPATYSVDAARDLVVARYDWTRAILPRLVDAHAEARERFAMEER